MNGEAYLPTPLRPAAPPPVPPPASGTAEERLHALENTLRLVSGNLAKIAASHNLLAEAVGELRAAEPTGAHHRTSLLKGTWWLCEGCGARLGIQEGDTLRIKSTRGETVIEFVSAPGATIRCTCRGCSRTNSVTCSG